MAITYVSNSLIPQGSIPLDGRTVITFDQIENIKFPYDGMQVYVTDEKTTYLINSDCFTTNDMGDTVMKPVSEIRQHASKVATSANIQGMMNGAKINADNITSGTIKADLLDVDAITTAVIESGQIATDRLDTRPGSGDNSGKITIMDNDIKVYDIDSNEPVIELSGSSIPSPESLTPTKLTADINQKDIWSQWTMENGLSLGKYIDLSSLSKGSYKITNHSDSLKFDWDSYIPQTEDAENWGVYLNYIIYHFNRELTSEEIDYYWYDSEVPNGCTILLKTPGKSIYGEMNYNVYGSEPYMKGSNDVTDGRNVVEFTLDGVEFNHKSGYNIYIAVHDDNSDNFYQFNQNEQVGQRINNSASISNILFSQLTNKSILGSDGVLYSTSASNYVKIYNNGHFEVSCGQYGMKISEDGIFFKKNSTQGYVISLDSLINN